MYAVASVLCKTLQMSFTVDPGVRYLTAGPTISALASVGFCTPAKRSSGKPENVAEPKREDRKKGKLDEKLFNGFSKREKISVC